METNVVDTLKYFHVDETKQMISFDPFRHFIQEYIGRDVANIVVDYAQWGGDCEDCVSQLSNCTDVQTFMILFDDDDNDNDIILCEADMLTLGSFHYIEISQCNIKDACLRLTNIYKTVHKLVKKICEFRNVERKEDELIHYVLDIIRPIVDICTHFGKMQTTVSESRLRVFVHKLRYELFHTPFIQVCVDDLKTLQFMKI